ncbi:MAG: hypothetical protein WBF13_04745 [Candidatus Zixiibacteriota bacterium]
MTPYEIVTSLIAIVALVISTASLIRARKVQARQFEFEAITAALAKKQLEVLEKNEQTEEEARVTAELVKVGRADYRFVIFNQGSAVASDVTFDIDPASPDNPLGGKECQRKLPYPSLQPGQSFTLIADLHMGSAMSYETHLKWKNPNGSQGTSDIHLST